MKRREFSTWVKSQAALRSGGKCESCTRRLGTGDWFYDHRVPDAMGGEPTLENCNVLCGACHDEKTHKTDIPRIAKAKRNFNRAHGIRKRSTFACSRDSKWKKKLDGTVVLR